MLYTFGMKNIYNFHKEFGEEDELTVDVLYDEGSDKFIVKLDRRDKDMHLQFTGSFKYCDVIREIDSIMNMIESAKVLLGSIKESIRNAKNTGESEDS